MTVVKFGGSVLQSSAHVKQCIKASCSLYDEKVLDAIVCSAVFGVPDLLMELESVDNVKSVDQLIAQVYKKHVDVFEIHFEKERVSELHAFLVEMCNDLRYDVLQEELPNRSACIQAYGALISTELFSKVLQFHKVSTSFYDARELICVICIGKKKEYLFDTTQLKKHSIPVITGCIARDEKNHSVLLGKGGSDLTASIVCKGMESNKVIFYKDVHGIYTADPKEVESAQYLSAVTYDEALSIGKYGGMAICSASLEPLRFSQKLIEIKNINSPEIIGTLILPREEKVPFNLKAMSLLQNILLYSGRPFNSEKDEIYQELKQYILYDNPYFLIISEKGGYLLADWERKKASGDMIVIIGEEIETHISLLLSSVNKAIDVDECEIIHLSSNSIGVFKHGIEKDDFIRSHDVLFKNAINKLQVIV